MEQFDLIVIGAGSGLEVSAAAAQREWRVAVIEEGPFGGTCLNRGCIPSKMLVHVADVARTIADAERFGIHATIQRIDWPAIVERTFAEIDHDAANILEGNRRAENITVFEGAARFTGHKQVEVDGRQLAADTIVIAAGTRPWVPEISGLTAGTYETTDTVMRLAELPPRLAILGGGFIGAELGHVFGSLGSQITIVTRGPAMVRDEDRDISRRMTEAYARRFAVRLSSEVRSVSRHGGGLTLQVGPSGDPAAPDSEPVECDALLVAVGRTSNADRLDVAATGVETDERGFVRTDEFMRTNVDGVWALGDIVGRWQLKHNANLEAAHVANNILNPEQLAAVEYHAMPAAIFGSPQIGSVGITEQAAEEKGIAYAVASQPYDETAYGQSIEDHDGFVKVLADPASGEILGCHVIGHEASVLVQEAVNVMRFRLPIDVIAQSIYIHPALPEVMQAAFGAVARQVSESRAPHVHGEHSQADSHQHADSS
ncbi:MAG: mycothione reductase [Chloroflexota bacterium]|nr:mycothione reductase [Chloroflexota bacterium]